MTTINRRDFMGSGLALLGSAAAYQALYASDLVLTDHPLVELAKKWHNTTRIATEQIEHLAALANKMTDRFGRVTPPLQEALLSVESALRPRFNVEAAQNFQSMVARMGAHMIGPIAMPQDNLPLWQMGNHPFADYQSSERLPGNADFVVIGAGLTGATMAYYLSEGRAQQSVLVLEASDPACEASGRNGGNFQLIPENYFGDFEGLLKEQLDFLQLIYPKGSEEVLSQRAKLQTAALMEMGKRNSQRFHQVVKSAGVECDFSPAGWLRIAGSEEEEAAIRREADFARDLGMAFEIYSAEQIRDKYKIPAQFAGRVAPESGNYDPFKFVNGLLKVCLARGVQLATRTRVEKVLPLKAGGVLVKTNRGEIRANRVLVATNAFSSEIFPELKTIHPYQSQIMNMEHVENTLHNLSVTENKGDLYYNFPLGRQYVDANGVKRGTVHIGGGLDSPIPSARDFAVSFDIMMMKKRACDVHFKGTSGQPPSRAWAGPMGFTDDRVPNIGFLHRGDKHIVVAAGFNGYGGTFCVEAGYTAALMATSGQAPKGFPEEVFSPLRFPAGDL